MCAGEYNYIIFFVYMLACSMKGAGGLWGTDGDLKKQSGYTRTVRLALNWLGLLTSRNFFSRFCPIDSDPFS